MTLRHRSGSLSTNGTALSQPALLTKTSMRPQCPSAAPAKSDMDCRSVTSSTQACAVPPEARISPADRQRLSRAWEVYAATGTSLSDWQARTDPALEPGSWSALALEPPRQALYDRCDARLTTMIDQGALDEVAALAARKLDPDLPAMKAVGYRELAACLRGEASLAEALEAAQRETRRYAKRQSTWLRGQMADWPRIEAVDHESQWRQFLALSPALTG